MIIFSSSISRHDVLQLTILSIFFTRTSLVSFKFSTTYRNLYVFPVFLILFLDLTPLIDVTSDDKILRTISKFRDLLETLPAGVITVGSFFHPHLCGSPRMPFIQPVRELLKSEFKMSLLLYCANYVMRK